MARISGRSQTGDRRRAHGRRHGASTGRPDLRPAAFDQHVSLCDNPLPETTSPASWSTSFITRLHRYKSLLLRRWWIPRSDDLPRAVRGSVSDLPDAARLSLDQQDDGGGQTESFRRARSTARKANNFYGTQIQLMQSNEVKPQRRIARALHASRAAPRSKSISLSQQPRTSIFELNAIGSSPDYTQAYLNAVMQKYLDFKKGHAAEKEVRVTTGDHRAA